MARNTELSNVDGHHKSRKSTSTEADIERLLRSLDARGYDISGVGELEADTSVIAGADELSGAPTRLGPRESGSDMEAQVASSDVTDPVTARKWRWYFYDPGGERLVEWAPAEVEELPTGDRGTEFSLYLRDSDLDDSFSQSKAMNVRTEEDFHFQFRWMENILSRFQAPDNEDLTVQLEAGDDADGSGPNKVEQRFIDANGGATGLRFEFDPQFDSFHVYDGNGDLIQTWDTAGEGIDFRGSTTEDVVWNSGSSRPSSPSEGQRFFDSDLGQPIWYDGTGWVDAQGATV